MQAPLITKPEPHPNPQVATLQEEIYKLECELGPEIAFSADAMVARHIKLLHTYNEIKDGTQALIAKVGWPRSTTVADSVKYAVMTHATVTAVHRELGLSLVE